MTIEQYRQVKKRKPKYGNEKKIIDDIEFDSKREANRYQELRLLLRAGLIANLRRQVSYPLAVNGAVICRYRADFVYVDLETGREVVEDSKGYRTKEYRLKAKLFTAIMGYSILET